MSVATLEKQIPLQNTWPTETLRLGEDCKTSAIFKEFQMPPQSKLLLNLSTTKSYYQKLNTSPIDSHQN